MMPVENPVSFRVGLNEGVILERSSLDKFNLYTDGLSGCVALVVANSQYVFMAHVSSITDSSTVEAHSDRYLQRVLDWMLANGREPIQIQVGLGADGGAGLTLANAFAKACHSRGIPFSKNDGDCCVIGFQRNGQMVLKSSVVDRKSFNTIGTLKRPDLIVGRIDADRYRFDGGVAPGDYNEASEDLINPEWKKSPALRRAVEVVTKAIYERSHRINYRYANDLLKGVDEQIKPTGRVVTEQQRVRICDKLAQLLSGMSPTTVNMDNEIGKIVMDVITPRTPSWIPSETRQKKGLQASEGLTSVSIPLPRTPSEEEQEKLQVVGKSAMRPR